MLGLELFFITSCVLIGFGTPILRIISQLTAVNLDFLSLFSDQLRSVILAQNKFVPVLCMSFTIHFFVSISAVFLFLGVGINTDLITLGAIFTHNLFSVVPISFGGWGVREGIAFVLYPAWGIEIETALAVSILFGVVMMIVGLIGGIFWLLSDDEARS